MVDGLELCAVDQVVVEHERQAGDVDPGDGAGLGVCGHVDRDHRAHRVSDEEDRCAAGLGPELLRHIEEEGGLPGHPDVLADEVARRAVSRAVQGHDAVAEPRSEFQQGRGGVQGMIPVAES